MRCCSSERQCDTAAVCLTVLRLTVQVSLCCLILLRDIESLDTVTVSGVLTALGLLAAHGALPTVSRYAHTGQLHYTECSSSGSMQHAAMCVGSQREGTARHVYVCVRVRSKDAPRELLVACFHLTRRARVASQRGLLGPNQLAGVLRASSLLSPQFVTVSDTTRT